MSVLSIPTRVAFVVLEFVFATPVCYVTNFLLFTVIHKPNESQGTQLITSLRSVRSVEFNKPQRTRPSAITTYANISHCYRFFQFFVWFISFILDRKRSITLSFGQTSSPSPPARYLKTLHTDNLYYLMMHIPDGRLVIVGAQRVQVRSSRSRVRITL